MIIVLWPRGIESSEEEVVKSFREGRKKGIEDIF